MTDYNLEVSELTRGIKLWREVRAVTVQLNLQGNTGATGTEATDFRVAASSVSGHPELCQGAHQALLRSLAQPPAAGGVQHRGPDASCGKSGLARPSPGSPGAAGTIPHASTLPLALAAATSPRLPGLWQKLYAHGSLLLQATASLSICFIDKYTYMYIFIFLYISIWGVCAYLSVSVIYNMK